MIELGVNLIPDTDIDSIVTLAAEAEQLGFSRCRVYDEGLVTRDVHVVMSAIASATERMTVGPGITNPYTRHPAQTAAAIASLDELSGGRASLGIGAGGSLTLDPIGLRRVRALRAIRETIEISRALFSGERVSYDGDFAALHDAQLDYARHDIEIWLAGRGPKVLQLGAELADGVMLDFLHEDVLADAVASIEQAASSAGRRCELGYSTVVVTEDDDLEFVRPHMTYRLVDAPPAIKQRIGLGDDDAARIRSAMSGGLEAAAEHVRDEWVLPFIIHGSRSECRRQLDRLIDRHGFSEFVLPMFDMPDPSSYLRRVATTFEG
ncbi:MAG: LLM class flavin-dependent oxidoreductase [Ilumatobacter sp.]|uniref:LLM class flavin-dependent oxidoreductase n=1 Tax=Ilumatobacter sp. TaxID=1967498 RepID=UPI0026340BE9|nr:LLM class flavin-dependent oxidoreductase [Ilumatobacter sp.]MDJ0767273.1 LLM class flavin-dependent oxidoreductase [Ilumatobacter sp.]